MSGTGIGPGATGRARSPYLFNVPPICKSGAQGSCQFRVRVPVARQE